MVTGAAEGRSLTDNTGGDGQTRSGSAGERKSPVSGRCFVRPVDRGGAMVTLGLLGSTRLYVAKQDLNLAPRPISPN